VNGIVCIRSVRKCEPRLTVQYDPDDGGDDDGDDDDDDGK